MKPAGRQNQKNNHCEHWKMKGAVVHKYVFSLIFAMVLAAVGTTPGGNSARVSKGMAEAVGAIDDFSGRCM